MAERKPEKIAFVTSGDTTAATTNVPTLDKPVTVKAGSLTRTADPDVISALDATEGVRRATADEVKKADEKAAREAAKAGGKS